MASYRFQIRAGEDWEDAGETPATKASTAREAFDALLDGGHLAAGEYRFKRSDERASHPWGHLQLTEDGTVILGER